MMKRTALVHIGLEKTGSTAIQRWLACNRELIQSSGIIMPTSIGYPNHTKLVSACLDEGVVDNIKSHHLFASGLSEQRFRQRVFADLDADIQRAPSDWHTLLITSELISSRLSTDSEVDRLVELLYQYVDSIRFVIFLRRQDQLALSRFSSILRSGHSEFFNVFVNYSPFNFLSVPDQRALSDDLFFYDFESILARFERVPGADLSVFLYGADRPVDVLLRLLGLEVQLPVSSAGRHNSALSAEAQYILASLNQIYPVQFSSGMRNDAYRRLQRRIESEITGRTRTVAKKEAEAFQARYQQINTRVVQRYQLVAGQVLFGDASDYPDAVDYSDLSSLLSDRLKVYRDIANTTVPAVETISLRTYNQLRRIKASLKRAASVFVR
jgi:hypothetical protein